MSNQTQLIWQDPNWLKEATDWIHAETKRNSIRVIGEIEQPHIYPWSTVMNVLTSEGTLYFKATAPETVYEAALTQILADWYPQYMPKFISVDIDRGWMLMRDGGEKLRASIRPTKDISPWKQVIPLLSEVQIGVSKHISELLSLGIPDMRLKHLPKILDKLLSDTDLLRLDQPDGLSSEDYQRAQDLKPHFTEVCAKLAAIGIPETLNHGDFHDGNVLVNNGQITLFDWGDGSLTHPFVTLRTFFVSIEIALEMDDYSFTPEMQDLLNVYLEPFQRFASQEKLLTAFSLSRPVATVVKTFAWHQTISRLDRSSRAEYQTILPELFREFLEYSKQ